MHVRLNSNTLVYYQPYKMSHDEKLKARAIIDDLYPSMRSMAKYVHL